MARLVELGKHFPCQSQGYEIQTDDTTTTMEAGDIVEAQWTSDRDISIDATFSLLHEVLRIKEEYPEFVLHYMKVETRRITVQYSIAPVEAHHSAVVLAVIWAVVKAIGTLIGIALAAYVIYTLVDRQYLFPVKPPTGHAVVTAKHTETHKGISGVSIYVDGDSVGRTDGGSVSLENLPIGDHQFAGEPKDGFHDPAPVTATITKDQTIEITIWYRPEDIPEPTTSNLIVYTSPVTGEVYVDGKKVGAAPITIEDLAIGNHSVGFGPVNDYITPPTQTVTIAGGPDPEVITGYYKLPDEDGTFEKYLRYALIGGGAIIGGVLILPPMIRALRSRGAK